MHAELVQMAVGRSVAQCKNEGSNPPINITNTTIHASLLALPACAAALFATGWPYEGDCGEGAPACWRQRDARFWSCIETAWGGGEGAGPEAGAPRAAPTATNASAGGVVRRLPLRSNFSPGCGRSMWQGGHQVSPCAWYNLSMQSLQPLLRVHEGAGSSSGVSTNAGDGMVSGLATDGSTGNGAASSSSSSSSTVQAAISDALAFSGGSSLCLSGSLIPGQKAAVQLFEAAVQVPPAGLWVRLTALAAEGVEARLALSVSTASGASSASSTTGSIELLPVLMRASAAADEGSAAGAQPPAGSSGSGRRGMAELEACACSRVACSSAAGAGGEAEAEPAEVASGSSSGAVPHWVTWQYCLGPAALAAALPADSGSSTALLLTGVGLLLTGTSAGNGAAEGAFEMHLGEQPACFILVCLPLPVCLPVPLLRGAFFISSLCSLPSNSAARQWYRRQQRLMSCCTPSTLQGSCALRLPRPVAARLRPPAC